MNRSCGYSVVMIISLLMPSLGLAAYQNPTVVSNQRQSNGSVVVTFAFSGNAGEPIINRQYVVTGTTTAPAVRNWVAKMIDELDLLRTAETLPALQQGQIVPRLNPTVSAPTAQQVWFRKLARYLRVKDAGLTAIVGDLAALKADLEATYVAGYLDGSE